MNNSENILFKVHQIDSNGIVNSIQYEEDFVTHKLISRTPITTENVNINTGFNWSTDSESKINLNYHYLEPDDSSITVIKIGGVEDLNPMNYATEITTTLNDPIESKPLPNHTKLKKESKIPNIPTMIRCQNCDTNFPTKYQYQRHQCEFNADKVVLKPDADIKDVDKGMRIKYDCAICGKQFVSKNNLERHQSSHDNTKKNICEHCNKQFVSENRLRIHKENHCKKAGDISKFYRSDVAVWKCLKCNQVFATGSSANSHAEVCKMKSLAVDCKQVINEPTRVIENSQELHDEFKLLQEELKSFVSKNDATLDNKNIEKVLTELLLQCEFCNRTYADKNVLVLHQHTHTTQANYECVTCREVFDSYTAATKHWLTKCSDEANLFYLPKLTYCECCDRTFKSHEILYTHKIKKKHYTPKIHMVRDVSIENIKSEEHNNGNENKDVIVKLIEDVLTTLSSSMNKNPEHQQMSDRETDKENVPPDVSEVTEIKMEVCSQSANSISDENTDEAGKKKRGRKRKWPKQVPKTRRFTAAVEKGFKYQCERCTKIWDSVEDLENHRDKDHAASFACEDCGQVLHSAKALVIHSRAHQSLKPYVCETCGRSYSQTSHLWQHMRFHQGIKPFACPHEGCEARYTIRPDLKDHIRKVHTRERPFKCAVCNKCFLTGSVYYQHRLIHTNDRRYGCDICQKRFFRADALNNHRRIHTDERPYPCEVCGREFRQKGDRNKHLRTQHPE